MARAPVQYDPAVIQQFADGLYRQADALVTRYVLLGVLGGAAATAPLFVALDAGVAFVGLVVATVVFGVLGGVAGQSRAFALRLQAQTALCQAQIEFWCRQSAGFAAGLAAAQRGPAAGPVATTHQGTSVMPMQGVPGYGGPPRA